MKLQRILAKDSRSAKDEAIRRFGADVLVVSNHLVNGMTELIVAVDVEPEAPAPAAIAPGSAEKFHAVLQERIELARRQVAQTPAAAPRAGISTAQARPMPLPVQNQSLGASAAAVSGAASQTPVKLAAISEVSEPNTDSSAPSVAPAMAPVAPASPTAAVAPTAAATATTVAAAPSAAATHITDAQARALVDVIRQELASLRREVRLGQQQQAWAQSIERMPWSQAMAEAGVPAVMRALWLDETQDMTTADAVVQLVSSQMHENMPPASSLSWAAGVTVLCGPPGSGKTSLTMRLAGEAVKLRGEDRVVVAALGDLRPGAWSQFQVLAARAGVQAFRASDVRQLQALIEDMSPEQTVLVDFAGPIPSAETFQPLTEAARTRYRLLLALPTDLSPTAQKRWLACPTGITPPWSGIVLTRWDQGVDPWPLVQQISDHRMPVVALSRGVSVADLDLTFSASDLLKYAVDHLRTHLSTVTMSNGASGDRLALAAPVSEPVLRERVHA